MKQSEESSSVARTASGAVNVHKRADAQVTHRDDLGEDDGKQRLDRSVDGGADDSDENVRPLCAVQAQDFEE